MKRISLLVGMLSVGLLAIMAFGASTSSATVLCKQGGLYCPIEKKYGVGAFFSFNPVTTVYFETEANGKEFSCSGGGFEMTVTDAGGIGDFYPVQTDISNLKFSECTNEWIGDPHVTVLEDGTATIRNSFGESWGRVYPKGNLIQFDSVWGGTCKYTIAGEPKLTGPGFNPPYTRITFLAAPATLVEGSSCQPKGLFRGTFVEVQWHQAIYPLYE